MNDNCKLSVKQEAIMKKPTLSVVIPVCNTQDYLKKCIDSILFQTLKSLEIIIVDDASSQDIRGFLQKEYSSNENIIYIRNEVSQRPGGARNRGMEKARGEYITFCDSDDWLDLNLYREAVRYMEDTSADIGMVSVIREDTTKANPSIFKCKYTELYELNPEMALRILSKQYKNGISIVPACINKIYRRCFLDSIHAQFEEDIYYQGILFTVDTFLQASKIICIPDVVYHHYLRKDSITQSFDDDHLHSFEECLKRMKQYFVKAGKYEFYEYTYYRILEHYLNVVISEIFEYIPEESTKKRMLRKAFKMAKNMVDIDRYLDYTSAEELRRHLQPFISDPFSILY